MGWDLFTVCVGRREEKEGEEGREGGERKEIERKEEVR